MNLYREPKLSAINVIVNLRCDESQHLVNDIGRCVQIQDGNFNVQSYLQSRRNYSAPVGERSRPIVINPSVCASVCLSVCVSVFGTAGPIFTKVCAQLPCDRGSVLFWRRCDTLYTSGFMDVVTFGRNGPHGVAWPA